MAVHVLGRTTVDFGPALVEAAFRVGVVEEWRLDGPAADGAVVAALKLRRPSSDNLELQLRPTFAHIASLHIGETPEEYRDLPSLMSVLSERVLWTLAAFGDVLGIDPPESLALGEEHYAYGADRGGHVQLQLEHHRWRHVVSTSSRCGRTCRTGRSACTDPTRRGSCAAGTSSSAT